MATASSIVVPLPDSIRTSPPALADALVAVATQAQTDLNTLLTSGVTNGKARGVITAIGAYTIGAAGLLTVTANGALAAQDTLTAVAGETWFLPAGITNVSPKDTGPYVIQSLGSAGSQVVLARPPWWQHGTPIFQGQEIRVGGEGAVFKGSTWRAMCAAGLVIGTGDPLLYPQHFRKTITLAAGTYTLGAGGGGEKLFLFDTTLSSVLLTQNTHAGTLGTERLEAPSASRVAGVAGTAAIVINSLVDAGTVAGADTSTVDVCVVNF